jgi:hypothetical protein
MHQPIADVEPEWRAATPTAVGFTMILMYVILLTNVLTGTDTSESAATKLRQLEIELTLDPTANPCTNFSGYVCNNYVTFHGDSAFRRIDRVVTHQIYNTQQYAECVANVEFDNIPLGQKSLAEALYDGYAVNGVTARVEIWQDVYVIYLTPLAEQGVNRRSVDKIVEVDCDCLGIDDGSGAGITTVAYDESVCDQLCVHPIFVGTPYDYPSDCVDAVKMFSRNATAPPSDQYADVLRRAFAIRATMGGLSDVNVFVGGGAGIAPDIPLTGRLSDMFKTKLCAEFKLVGGPAQLDSWPESGFLVNAMYVPNRHAIFIYGGFLHYPFYHPDFSDSLLRGIDFVIAHEFGHAMDAKGNDSALGEALLLQLETVSKQNNTNVTRTVHEDIADYYGSKYTVMDAVSFLQFGQMWCGEANEFSDDVHAPGVWRINMTAINSPYFQHVYCN